MPNIAHLPVPISHRAWYQEPEKTQETGTAPLPGMRTAPADKQGECRSLIARFRIRKEMRHREMQGTEDYDILDKDEA